MCEAGYALIDTGDGRRLERFGPVLVDRPAPVAEARRRDEVAWSRAAARFEGTAGAGWLLSGPIPRPWLVEHAALRLELRLASAGQVGLFPEHAGPWSRMRGWIEAWRAGTSPTTERCPEVLSLFAYTGGTTLSCAAAGAQVVHVDASRTAVDWARRNACWSGLSERPIRWIVDDAAGFVRREIRRGRRYEGVVLDPPSYGHGPAGKVWRIERDLEPLLDDLAELISDDAAFVLLTSHTPGHDADRLAALLDRGRGGRVAAEPLVLRAESGARLDLGAAAWWTPA